MAVGKGTKRAGFPRETDPVVIMGFLKLVCTIGSNDCCLYVETTEDLVAVQAMRMVASAVPGGH